MALALAPLGVFANRKFLRSICTPSCDYSGAWSFFFGIDNGISAQRCRGAQTVCAGCRGGRIVNLMSVFKSPLGSLIEQYVEYRRMHGYKSASGEEDIRQFDVYAAASPIAADRLTKELVVAYIARRPSEKQATQSHRISAVRCFGKYLVRCGVDGYVLPNGVLAVAKYGFVPHVFSLEEVARLMNATDLLPCRANSLRLADI